MSRIAPLVQSAGDISYSNAHVVENKFVHIEVEKLFHLGLGCEGARGHIVMGKVYIHSRRVYS